MYVTAHLDLISASVAARLEGSARGAEPTRLPAAPARITSWGPRASSRPARVTVPLTLDLPRPRDIDLSSTGLVLLDA